MCSLARSAVLLACLSALAGTTPQSGCTDYGCVDETSQLQIPRGHRAEHAPPAPYNFDPPPCDIAEPQAPRDLLPRAPGRKVPKAPTLNAAQVGFLPLTNVHFHLGAEHRALHYRDGRRSQKWDATPHTPGVRPGFECRSDDLHPWQLSPHAFKFCKAGVEVGRTYEVHYVHSSAGYSEEDLEGTDVDPICDGLGGAANGRGLLNPTIAVEALVFQVVWGAPDLDVFNGWDKVADLRRAVMYQGSTTSAKFNNTICSPYSVTWHVDRTCHRISPRAFDYFCMQMERVYGLEEDLNAHSARALVGPELVVKPKFVALCA